jgi:hypothetical protein
MSINHCVAIRIVRSFLPALIAIGVFISGPVARAQQAQQYRYYCDALHVYYPMVTTCKAGWRQVPVATQGLRRPETNRPTVAEPPLPSPAPRQKVTREVIPALTAPTSAPALPTPEINTGQSPTIAANHDDRLPATSNGGGLPIGILLLVATAGALGLITRRYLGRLLRQAISWFLRIVPIFRK